MMASLLSYEELCISLRKQRGRANSMRPFRCFCIDFFHDIHSKLMQKKNKKQTIHAWNTLEIRQEVFHLAPSS